MAQSQMSDAQTERLAKDISQLLSAGGTLGDAYRYTQEDYEVLYALGHSLYSQERYPDAVKAFGYLVMHNHLERRFISAYAASLQMVKSYEEALSYHLLASVMKLTDPVPTYHQAECLIALSRFAEARECLYMVVRQCSEQKIEALKSRAQAILALINNRDEVKA